ncbi:hypothetical protein [Carp edema virus]|nr:hypothetical protein [Carp edema virus]
MILKNNSLYRVFFLIGSDNVNGMQINPGPYKSHPRLFTFSDNSNEVELLTSDKTTSIIQDGQNTDFISYDYAYYFGLEILKYLPIYEHVIVIKISENSLAFTKGLTSSIPNVSLNVNGIFYNSIVSKLGLISKLPNAVLSGVIMMEGERSILNKTDHLNAFNNFKTNLFGKIAEYKISTKYVQFGIIGSSTITGLSHYVGEFGSDPNTTVVDIMNNYPIEPTETKPYLSSAIHFSHKGMMTLIEGFMNKFGLKIKSNSPQRNIFKVIFQFFKTYILCTFGIVILILVTFAISIWLLFFDKDRKKLEKLKGLFTNHNDKKEEVKKV